MGAQLLDHPFASSTYWILEILDQDYLVPLLTSADFPRKICIRGIGPGSDKGKVSPELVSVLQAGVAWGKVEMERWTRNRLQIGP